MTSSATEQNFSGPYQQQLGELAELMEWLWSEHDKSFVKAGDDKVYAFGGNGYTLVLDESKWQGLIEFLTPKGAMTIKPDENGKITVTGPSQDEKAVKELLKDGIQGVRQYYENRYWSTPKTSKD
jgi:hypothetical protein